MTDLPPRLRTISAFGIISASFLAGSILGPPGREPAKGSSHSPLLLPLTLLSSFSFLFTSLSLVRTLEQRRGELFGAAAVLVGIATPLLPVRAFLKRVRGDGVREVREEEEGEGKRGSGWKGGFALAGAVVGAWALLRGA